MSPLARIAVPSKRQFCVYILLSLIMLIIPNLHDTQAIKESGQDILPILKESIRNFGSFLDTQTVVPHLPELMAWGLVGLAAYLVLLLLENAAISILNLAIFENSYIHKLPLIDRLKNDVKITERRLFRLGLIIFLIIWGLFAVFLLLPFAISTFHSIMVRWQEPLSWKNAAIAMLVVMLAQHLSAIFFQLLFIKPDHHYDAVK